MIALWMGMQLQSTPLFSLMQQRLQYNGERQALLAQNIANADTPDYRSKDLKPFEAHRSVEMLKPAMPMERTHGNHMMKETGGASRFKQQTNHSSYETTLNDNTVSISEEMAKVSLTQMDYQKTLSLYRKNMELFRIALGKGGGG